MLKRNPNSEHVIAIAQNLLKSGQIQDAIRTLHLAHNQSPTDTRVTLELSRLLIKLKKLKEASLVLENSIKHGNQEADVVYMLSSALHMLNKHDQALHTVKTMTRLHPGNHHAYNLKGHILSQTGKHEDAKQAFEKSIEIEPNNTNGLNNLAWLLRAEGQKEAAIAHFERALAVNPGATEAIFGLCMLKPDDKSLDAVQLARKSSSLSDQESAELYFAQAKIFDQKEQHGKAFDSYSKANSLWRKQHPFNLKKEINFFNSIKELLPNQKEAPNIKPIGSTPKPIFIVGLPRSSTTLIEQILASHSAVTASGELDDFPKLAIPALRALSQGAHKQDAFEQVRKRYLSKISQLSEGKQFVVDKLPQNFLFIGLIKVCLPHAKIIHCLRNPLDNCLSLFKHHFPMAKHEYAYSLEDIAEYYILYRDIMSHWQSNFEQSHFSVRYESLLDNTEDKIREVLEYCELGFESSCLKFYETDRLIKTASSEQVREPLTSNSVDQWRNYERYLEGLKSTLRSYS